MKNVCFRYFTSPFIVVQLLYLVRECDRNRERDLECNFFAVTISITSSSSSSIFVVLRFLWRFSVGIELIDGDAVTNVTDSLLSLFVDASSICLLLEVNGFEVISLDVESELSVAGPE